MIVIIQKLTVHVPMIHSFNYMFCSSHKTTLIAGGQIFRHFWLVICKIYVVLFFYQKNFFLIVILMFSASFIDIRRADTSTRFLWILAFMYSRKTGFPFCSWIYWDSSWREAIIHGVPSSNTHNSSPSNNYCIVCIFSPVETIMELEKSVVYLLCFFYCSQFSNEQNWVKLLHIC